LENNTNCLTAEILFGHKHANEIVRDVFELRLYQ
jgi:hypothetical protein